MAKTYAGQIGGSLYGYTSKEEQRGEGKSLYKHYRSGSREFKRIPLGVKVLDEEELKGGVPSGSFILVSGNSGAGKTILTLQAVKKNYQQYPVVYVSTEMTLNGLRAQYKSLFGEDDVIMTPVKIDNGRPVIESNILPDLVLIDFYTLRRYAWSLRRETEKKVNPLSHYTVINIVKQVIDEYYSGKDILLIIDSASMLYAHAPAMARTIGLELMWNLKHDNLTAIITAQYSPTTDATYGYGIEHVVDGVIEMYREDPVRKRRGEEAKRYLAVVKMRATPISLRRYEYVIKPGVGIEIVSSNESG